MKKIIDAFGLKNMKWIYLVFYILLTVACIYGIYWWGFKNYGDFFLHNWKILLPVILTNKYIWDVAKERITNELMTHLYQVYTLLNLILIIGVFMALYQWGIKNTWEFSVAHWQIIISSNLALFFVFCARGRLYASFVMITLFFIGLYDYINSDYKSYSTMFAAACINLIILKIQDKRFMLYYVVYVVILIAASQLILLGMIGNDVFNYLLKDIGEAGSFQMAGSLALFSFAIFTPASLSIAWKWTHDSVESETHKFINMLGGGSIWMAGLSSLYLLTYSTFDSYAQEYNLDYVWPTRVGCIIILLALGFRFMDPIEGNVVQFFKDKFNKYFDEIDDIPM